MVIPCTTHLNIKKKPPTTEHWRNTTGISTKQTMGSGRPPKKLRGPPKTDMAYFIFGAGQQNPSIDFNPPFTKQSIDLQASAPPKLPAWISRLLSRAGARSNRSLSAKRRCRRGLGCEARLRRLGAGWAWPCAAGRRGPGWWPVPRVLCKKRVCVCVCACAPSL